MGIDRSMINLSPHWAVALYGTIMRLFAELNAQRAPNLTYQSAKLMNREHQAKMQKQ